MKYHFFYDETEHSRKINIATVSAPNYYDNFIAVILGWKEADEQVIRDSYLKFEKKYSARKSIGELKSQTLRQEQFIHGLASLNKPNIEFINDFLSLFDQKIYLYFALASKIEFVVTQVLDQYRNSFFFDMDAVRYSITKAICLYRPTEILEHTFGDTAGFVQALQSFLLSRIEEDRGNPALKETESEAFQNILAIISNAHDPKTIEWNYDFAFLGFSKYLREYSISDIALFLDKEGKNGADSRTLKAAKRVGFSEAQEVDSKECIGVRFSDIFAGIIAKLMKAISNELSYSEKDTKTQSIRLLASVKCGRIIHKRVWRKMDIQKAKEILSILADGINPITGEALATYDSCNQADVVRALHSVLMELDKQPKKNPQPQPENAGKPWTTEEDELLLTAYRGGVKTSELAKRHKRTNGSIAARLVKLGEIKERSEAR